MYHPCSYLHVMMIVIVKLHDVNYCCLPIQLGNTALHDASSEGHTDTVELLLLKGAQVDSRNNVSSVCIVD